MYHLAEVFHWVILILFCTIVFYYFNQEINSRLDYMKTKNKNQILKKFTEGSRLSYLLLIFFSRPTIYFLLAVILYCSAVFLNLSGKNLFLIFLGFSIIFYFVDIIVLAIFRRYSLHLLMKKVDKILDTESGVKDDKKRRLWLSELFTEAEEILNELDARKLETKSRPALKGAEEVRIKNKQLRELNQKYKLLEYELKTYHEYFPIIEETSEFILEDDSLFSSNNDNNVNEIDPVKRFLTKEEFNKLSPTEKSQKALDNYLSRNHSKIEIGRMYERYIGYKYEMDGWTVKFTGIIDNFDDLGRDLICTKGNKIEIVQCKNWSSRKEIREKHLYQLFGTYIQFKIKQSSNYKITPVFTHTTELSKTGKIVCKELGIREDKIAMSKDYPMIKCNINKSKKDKIYHLPFDQQYDKVLIGNNDGEFYAKTVKEAESKKFRRAFRYMGPA